LIIKVTLLSPQQKSFAFLFTINNDQK